MARFIDFLTGGNAKVMANHLADMHRDCGGDYPAVVMAVFADICQQKPKNNGFFNYFLSNQIRNYCDLAAAQLNALAAPPGTPLLQTMMDFEDALTKHLRARGIPENLISGNNTSLTKDLAEELSSM